MPIPPPPPLPPPVYYPQASTNLPSSNANGSIEEGRPITRTPPIGGRRAFIKSPLDIICVNLVYSLTQLCLGAVVISALYIPNISDLSVIVEHTVLCTVGVSTFEVYVHDYFLKTVILFIL